MPKSTKTFVLSTSQLNSKGFRTLTSGADLSDFIANPLMYWLHMEPEGKTKDEPMPIGFWEDIKVVGDEITAVPNFDENDPFAMSIYNKVEHGTIRAASIEVEPIKLDADRSNWVKGQKLPTVTKWTTGEASICDRGSNKGAIVKLKHKGNTVSLSEHETADEFFNTLLNPDKNDMKIKLNKKASKVLKLAEDTELDATEIVDKLVEQIEERDSTIAEKEGKVTELETKVSKLADDAENEKITLMVDKAVTDRKITLAQKEKYITLAKKDFGTTKEILDGIASSPSVTEKLNQDDTSELGSLMKLNYQELDKANKLIKLKELSPDTFKLKYKERYGKEYAGK